MIVEQIQQSTLGIAAKEEQSDVVLATVFNQLYITNKMENFSFKVDVLCRQ